MTTPESTVGTDEVVVTLDDPANRYDILLGGTRIGRLDYRRHGDVLDLHHTEIDPAFEGRGLGARLVGDALDDIREPRPHRAPAVLVRPRLHPAQPGLRRSRRGMSAATVRPGLTAPPGPPMIDAMSSPTTLLLLM